LQKNGVRMVASLCGARIARVSTVPYFVATQLAGQIKYLSATGAQVVVITSKGPELERLSSENVSIESIEMARSISPLKDIVALFKLYRCFRRNRFDIVHSTTPKAGLLCVIAGFLAGIPVRLHTYTGQPWVSLKGSMRLVARLSDWMIGRLATRCYADSESQRLFLIEQGIVSVKKIVVIGKGSLAGVDLERFDPAKWSKGERVALRQELKLSEKGQVILFVGRLTRDKGISELLEAFDSILKSGYEVDLLLVGPLDDERGGAFEFSAAQMRRVKLLGYTDSPERYMAIADFLCLPSYREGFGTVVIEAAAMGVPTLGTSIYGLTDAVVDGQTGILVPPQDASALTVAMQAMLDQSALLATKMGQSAQARCFEHFDARKINTLLGEEYARLLFYKAGRCK
jgi:glycosyltransferase involved in cell wall biosynthesis